MLETYVIHVSMCSAKGTCEKKHPRTRKAEFTYLTSKVVLQDDLFVVGKLAELATLSRELLLFLKRSAQVLVLVGYSAKIKKREHRMLENIEQILLKAVK